MKKTEMPDPSQAFSGRDEKMPVSEKHFVNGNQMTEPFPQGLEKAMFALGCFWGQKENSGNLTVFIRPLIQYIHVSISSSE